MDTDAKVGCRDGIVSADKDRDEDGGGDGAGECDRRLEGELRVAMGPRNEPLR
jgi:hypothetical protein